MNGKINMCVEDLTRGEEERVGKMNSPSTVGGIRGGIEHKVVVERSSDNILSFFPGAGVACGGQSQRNQDS